ncbi:MAG: hypothetical protein P1R58_05630 [bacterium]|nr:hypothetical protein [bacterium]
MKRIFMLLILMGLAVALVSGCGDDDEDKIIGGAATDTSFITGKANDPALALAQGFVNTEDPFSGIALGMEFSTAFLAEKFSGFSKSAGSVAMGTAEDSVVIDTANFGYAYDAVNGWHIFTFVVSAWEEDGWFDSDGIDSVKVLKGGTFMPTPDSTFDALQIRAHLAAAAADTSSNFNLASHHSANISGVDNSVAVDTITISAASTDSVVADISTDTVSCEMTISRRTTATDIVMLRDNGDCPFSGTANILTGFNIECSGNLDSSFSAIEGLWSADITFAGSSATIIYKNGNTKWTVTEPCTEGTSKAWWQTNVQ